MTVWERIDLEVQTPLFGGGYGSAGKSGTALRTYPSEVRVSEIRGAARFWLRALVGAVVGNNLDAVGEVESAVFGSTERESRVLFRVPNQPRSSDSADGGFLNQEVRYKGRGFRGNAYLVGPGLSSWVNGSRSYVLTRQHVPPGESVCLLVRRTTQTSGSEWTLARAALWLALTVGGLGARTHRGFGALQVVGSTLEFPTLRGRDGRADATLFAESRQRTIPVEFFPGLSDAVSVVLRRTVAPEQSDRIAEHPVVGHGAVEVHASKAVPDPTYPGDWREALAGVGLDLRRFRANEHAPSGQVSYHPKVKTKEWLEVVHGAAAATDHFPLGALGLPIVFKKGVEVNAVRDDTSVRWPSPLWLRLAGQSNAHRLVSLAFHTSLPGDGGPVEMAYAAPGTSRQLRTAPDDFRQIAQAWFKFVDDRVTKRPAP